MKRFYLLFFIFIAAFFAKAQKEIMVDANAEVRKISGTFNAIKVSNGIDVYLSQSANEAIAVSASEDKFKQGIKTIIENGILKIYYDDENGWSLKNKKLKVYVSFKNIDKIDASGACGIIAVGNLTVNSLSISLSGASDFKGAVKVNDLQIDLSGASDVIISGSTNNLKISSSGASDFKGFNLITELCTVKVSGASDVNITVTKELKAYASGASDIYYKGDAVVKEMHSSGASSISRKS